MSHDLHKDHCSGGRLPLRRLQLAFNRIIETSIPFNLKAIERHTKLIEEYRQNNSWDQLMREQINGLHSVQRLKSDLRELESLAKQVTPEDYPTVGQQIIPIKIKVDSVVQQFFESNKDINNPLIGLNPNKEMISSANISSDTDFTTNEELNTPFGSEKVSTNEDNLQIMAEISDRKESLISWLHLKKELNDLNDIFNTLMTTLMRQKETVHSIENNVENAHQNVLIGTQHLSKASALKSAFVPLTAGLVGGAVFGPIGAMAGFKFSGIAAAVGAGIISYSGVRFIQKKSITDEEFELISAQNTKTDENKID